MRLYNSLMYIFLPLVITGQFINHILENFVFPCFIELNNMILCASGVLNLKTYICTNIIMISVIVIPVLKDRSANCIDKGEISNV
ncbi:hypothetical protein ACFL7D_06285 [candidate division KSB1 bacterium]